MNAKSSYLAVIDRLTLEQKIALCSGLNEWDTKEMKTADGTTVVPSVKVADGPHGLRKTVGQGDNLGLAASEPATCFPAESLLACSFDRTLAFDMGAAIADEAGAAGVSTILGPGANIKRNPLCGRNFEYLSEDPYLAGRMAAAYILGAENRGIGTSLKHFACNSQEYFRMTSDSRIDERTLRELYLPAFEYAVKKGKPATVMCAYNKINGISCSDNQFLLDTILRDEWGYEGMVVSDWGAVNNRINAFRAGCDLVMPGGSAYEEADVLEAVLRGRLSEDIVDRSAARVAAFSIERTEKLAAREKEPLEFLHQRSHLLAKTIAEESAVLLKNNDSLLPIDTDEPASLAVIGSMAEIFRFQGSGSSKINAVQKENFLALLNEAAGHDKALPYARGYRENGDTNEEMLQEAVELAKSSERVLILAGLPEQYEAEGMDRRTMALPAGQNQLIEEVSKVNPHVIVVLICGCVVELPWADEVESILWMGLSGQAGAAALVKLLTGEVNPSGRLAESWPIRYEDCPSSDWYLKDGRDAIYRERFHVGYRYYDKAGIPVRFPFGHGLSYTTFEYSELTYEYEYGRYEVSVTVRNTGNRSGKEAVLLFVEAPQDGINRPIRELKGFEKIELQPGESRVVQFTTDERTFSTWNQGWKTYAGEYRFEVGDQSIPIQVSGDVWNGTDIEAAEAVPETERSKAPEKYTVNSTVQEVAGDVWLLRCIYRWFEKKQARLHGRGSVDYLAAMRTADESPLRAVQNFVGLKHHFAQAIADLGNKKYMEGFKHLLK